MEESEVTVRAVRRVGPDTVALDLETPSGFDALPGQFVLVRSDVDGEPCARHYTISSPDVDETFEITVGVDPEGTLSPWLSEREAGDSVRVEGPFGNVSYDASSDGDVVVLAGGPGVGPAVGVAEAALDADHEAALVYEDDAPAHEDRLDALDAAGADVAIVREPGFAGAVAVLADRVNRSDGIGDEVYVFGFRPFCERALEALEAAGVDRDEVAVENFG